MCVAPNRKDFRATRHLLFRFRSSSDDDIVLVGETRCTSINLPAAAAFDGDNKEKGAGTSDCSICEQILNATLLKTICANDRRTIGSLIFRIR